MNRHFSLKQTLAGIGTSVVLAASASGLVLSQSAVALNTNSIQPAATMNQPQSKLSLASGRNFCRKSESTFVTAQTKDFWLNICGGDLPNTYVGVNKRTGDTIRLPLASYSRDGQAFTARNGNVQYLITFGTTKGDVLVVLRGQREILRQFIY